MNTCYARYLIIVGVTGKELWFQTADEYVYYMLRDVNIVPITKKRARIFPKGVFEYDTYHVTTKEQWLSIFENFVVAR